MPRMISTRALWTLVRAGDFRARLRANRDGAAAIRLHLAGAAVGTGLLDALADGAATTGDLARRMAVPETSLLAAFLRVVAAAGFVAGGGNEPWRLTSSGRAVVDDDLVRAAYEAFPGFHTALYREIGPQLAGGPGRRDVADQGELIARISAAFEPFVLDRLTRAVEDRAPRRVLDIGCGAGLQLAAMLSAAPEAEGVGIDVDAGAVSLAEKTLAGRGLSRRAQVLQADVRDSRIGPLEQPFDLALLANVVYYVPMGERVALFRDIARLLAPGGALLVVTTVAMQQLFSRHFDLLLRAQQGQMELSDVDTLLAQLVEAGLRPERPRRLAPGVPAVAVLATRPG
jgi:SAM-dependent methyltransferase